MPVGPIVAASAESACRAEALAGVAIVSAVGRMVGGAVGRAVSASGGTATCVPHFGQKPAPGGTAAPHLVHDGLEIVPAIDWGRSHYRPAAPVCYLSGP